MAGRGSKARGRRTVCRPVAALRDLPAGPQLASALSGLLLPALSGHELVLVLKALYRQSNHDRALLLETIAEIQRRKDPAFGLHGDDPEDDDPEADDPEDDDDEPAGGGSEWPDDPAGAAEVRAALVLTRQAANALTDLAKDLTLRMPAVLGAMATGRLDQPRARCFSKGTELLSDEHARAVAAALLPEAHRLTTGQLAAAIQKASIELDPEFARRRYEKALLGRRVHGIIRADGTADLCGLQLAADEVAAVCDRLDAIARHLKASGHPHPINRIRADLYVGLLDGTYSGLNEAELLDHLVAHMPAPSSTPDTEPESAPEPEPTPEPEALPESEGAPETSTVEDECDRGAGVRGRGLRLLTCLPTIAGLDQRTSELLGWGWLHAELARRISSAPRASWWYVLVEDDGTTVDVGPIRRRPATAWAPGPAPSYRHVEVWLRITRAELTALLDDPPPGWSSILADITNRVANRPVGPPNGDPADRFPNAALRRWIHIRDRHCTFPGCRVAAHQADIDHSREHANGGPTVDSNLGAACGGDHGLHTRHGWRVRQPKAGRVIWTSRLGHDYIATPPPAPATALARMPNPTPPEPECGASLSDETWQAAESLVYLPGPVPRTTRAPKVPPPPRDWGEPPF